MSLRVLFNDYQALRERCDIGSVHFIDHPDYEGDAIVPAGDWQPVSERIAESLEPDADTPDSTVVELVKPPSLDGDGDSGPSSVASAEFLGVFGPQPAGLLATSFNSATTGLYIGLHIDYWDRATYSMRRRSRRRLCLNLGPGSRYLHVADLDIAEIGAAFGLGTDDVPAVDVVRRYLKQGHPLRCFRLRLDPGDGYLAPTELYPHDGSTMACPDASSVAMWLGHWARSTLKSIV
jgi:hypothetical protein